MLYEVNVPNPDGSVERFFVNREERVRKGDIIEQMTLTYTVRHIEPEPADDNGVRANRVTRRSCGC